MIFLLHFASELLRMMYKRKEGWLIRGSAGQELHSAEHSVASAVRVQPSGNRICLLHFVLGTQSLSSLDLVLLPTRRRN